MHRAKCVLVILKYFLILQCLADQSSQDNDKLLNCFTTYLNGVPDIRYKYEDATLINFQETEPHVYKIEAQLKATDIHNEDDIHILQCTANLSGEDVCPEIVSHNCQEQATSDTSQDARNEQVTEEVFKEQISEKKPINIDNDIVHDADNVQPCNMVTVEDEVVARPIAQPGTPCVGCSTHVNLQASGVNQLANLGIQHLDMHDHNVKHRLGSVVDVERQVQVVNGIRYILTLLVDFDSCSLSEIESCAITKTCKIVVLEKPWKKLPDGSKFRSILSNNCTEEWLFGDEGEVLIQNLSTNTENNEASHNSDFSNIVSGEEVFTERNTNLQSKPQLEKNLPGDEIKRLEEQIISNQPNQHKHLYDVSEMDELSHEKKYALNTIDSQSSAKDVNFEINSLSKQNSGSLNDDKKKAIDDLLFFFNYAPFNHYSGEKIETKRITRSEDYQVPLNDFLKPKHEIQIVGGVTDQDVRTPQNLALLEESLQKYHMDSHIKQYHKVIELSKVTTQVVAGSLTKLYFKIAPTNCEVNEKGQATSSICRVVENSEILSCESKVWEKPWLGFKNFNVTCNVDKKSRKKRDIPGGLFERNPKDPEYKDLADESMNYYLQKSGTTIPHQVVKIVKVTTQVVAGTLTRINFTIAPANCTNKNIKICNSMIWEKPWMNFKDIKVSCDIIQNTRKKRELGSTVREQDAKDPRFFLMAKESIEKYLNTSGITQYYKLVEISTVTTQVVAGTMTVIDFKIAPTNCETSVNVTVAPFICKVDENANMQLCRSKVWEKPWMNFKEINVSCSGDLSLLNNLVQQSLQKLESSSLNRYRQRVLKVNDYSTKITSGKLTTISFDVGYTSCLKFQTVGDIKDCEFLSNMTTRHCYANIWERLWLENGRSIDVNCQDDETLIIGNTNLEHTAAAEHLAIEALKYIEAKYPHPKKQKVVKIFSLQKQIVAGVHYRMKVEVGYTNCTALSIKQNCKLLDDAGSNKFCRVNIWVQPWKDHPPNFRVSCDYPLNSTADIYHHLQAEQLFNDFLSTYKPDYRNDIEEMGHRFQIFKENVKKIHELNIHEKGTAKYGITRFSDLSYNEFKAKYTGLKQNKRDYNQIPMRKASIPLLDLPQSFDWRDQAAVTEVKDQGSCGSCWAFSVTGNIEGQWKIKTGNLESLSEQELVDCDKLDDGCQGGLPDNAYRAIESMGGLMTEKDYPYNGEIEKCVFNKTLARVQVTGALNISTNETEMAKWLVANGPISIGINANAMQFYMGGISHPWKILCDPGNLDHGVLIVGYGEKFYPLFNKRLPYWIVKNSWGKSWGEQGYYRVFRGDGTCGVNMMASSAIV